MMNKHWKGLIAVAGALTLTVTAAGCSGGATSGPNNDRPEGEIHVLVLGDAAASAEKAAADRFNETSDIKVVVDTGATAGGEYNTTVRTQIGTANAPDIFMSWGRAGIQPLIDAGALKPLNDFIKDAPELKDDFIPSVFDEEVVDDQVYGIPMRGIAPEFLYYNTKVLADAGLKPAATWDELLAQMPTLEAAGVIPIGLAGADKWPQQIWLQYAYARLVGNEKVSAGLAGDASVWESEESQQALADLRELIDSGAFGSNYDSVSYGADGSAALLRTGKSAYELMGSWHYATVGDSATLGWTAFPALDAGTGEPNEIVGNLSNFYNVAADTRYPDTVRDFLKELYSDQFLNDQITLGNTPPTTNAADLINAQSDLDAKTKEHLNFVVNIVADAPAFGLSWDQRVPASQQTASQTAAADFFNGTISADEFIKQMVQITSADSQ